MASKRRGLAANVWRSGVIQGLSTDALIVVGLVGIGVGIGQVSVPGLWIYAGLVCVGVGLLVAYSAAKVPEPPPRRQRGES